MLQDVWVLAPPGVVAAERVHVQVAVLVNRRGGEPEQLVLLGGGAES
jgi:hypothetical protein